MKRGLNRTLNMQLKLPYEVNVCCVTKLFPQRHYPHIYFPPDRVPTTDQRRDRNKVLLGQPMGFIWVIYRSTGEGLLTEMTLRQLQHQSPPQHDWQLTKLEHTEQPVVSSRCPFKQLSQCLFQSLSSLQLNCPCQRETQLLLITLSRRGPSDSDTINVLSTTLEVIKCFISLILYHLTYMKQEGLA